MLVGLTLKFNIFNQLKYMFWKQINSKLIYFKTIKNKQTNRKTAPNNTFNPINNSKHSNISQASKNIHLMAERIQIMKQTIYKTSPRSFGLFFLLSTIPTFYFLKEMLQSQYHQQKFVNSINNCLNYYYFKNTLFLGITITSLSFKFIDPLAKNIVHTTPTASLIILPIIFTLVGVLQPDTISKYTVIPAAATDFTTVMLEASITNQGSLPFWYYNFRHYNHFFDLFVIACCYWGLKRLNARMTQKAYEFYD